MSEPIAPREPWPGSEPAITSERVCGTFSLSQLFVRRPASYFESARLAITPSRPCCCAASNEPEAVAPRRDPRSG